MMKRVQRADIDISRVVCYVKAGEKLTLPQIRDIKSKTENTTANLTYQFSGKECCTELMNKMIPHQLILPLQFRAQALEMFHNQQRHQRLQCTIALVSVRGAHYFKM